MDNVETCCTHANESDSDENVDQLYISLDVESDADGSSSEEENSSYESDSEPLYGYFRRNRRREDHRRKNEDLKVEAKI